MKIYNIIISQTITGLMCTSWLCNVMGNVIIFRQAEKIVYPSPETNNAC